ncbi:MAG TPA: hypothetical protein VEA61_15815 [Allosphingosinicella sp.]|nr:hypothetical protein [Allosphingosinicella sp.]
MAERRRRRWVEAALIAAAAAALAWGGWGTWHDRRLADRFDDIHLGMDRRTAEAVLGGPDWEGGCGLGGVLTLPRADCARELGWSSAFAPFVPTYYVVQLDARGRVIEADPIHSP